MKAGKADRSVRERSFGSQSDPSTLGEAAFYAYAYPAPAGFNTYPVQPEAAYYHEKLGEFILPYEAVRKADNPAQALLSFLQTTYDAAANLAKWDRAALERKPLQS